MGTKRAKGRLTTQKMRAWMIERNRVYEKNTKRRKWKKQGMERMHRGRTKGM